MAKKRNDHSFNNGHPTRHAHHPIFRQKLTLGQKAADAIANFGGSWRFLSLFALFLLVWISLNTWLLLREPFDPFPFLLLNITLSTLAAIQAPVILMTQNRQEERDRIEARYDHAVNRKAEREIQKLQKELDSLKRMMKELR